MFEITINHEDSSKSVTVQKPEVIIGRKNEFQAIDLDLTPDDTVSRVHARVALVEAGVLLEDLNSSLGTTVNGFSIKEPVLLNPQDAVVMGATTLCFAYKATQSDQSPAARQPNPKPPPIKKPARKQISRSQANRGASQHRPRRRDAQQATPQAHSKSQEGYKMELELQLKDKRWAVTVEKNQALVGRKNEECEIDVDLTGDLSVSRVHARIWEQDGQCWIEDQGSRHGVKINGEAITAPSLVRHTDQVHIGATLVRIQLMITKSERLKPKPRRKASETTPMPVDETVGMPIEGRYPVFKASQYPYSSPEVRRAGKKSEFENEDSPVGEIRILTELMCDAEPQINSLNKKKSVGYLRELMMCPIEFGRQLDIETLSVSVVERAIKIIPGVGRAALFVANPAEETLVPLAHEPSFKPILSSVLAQQSLADRKGIIWRQCDKEESMRRLPIQSGMYAPLICGDIECGLLIVDTKQKELEYAPEDLSLLMVLAQIAASDLVRLQIGK